MTAVIGIDPGLTGAIAFYSADSCGIEIWEMPVVGGRLDPYTLTGVIAGCGKVDKVAVEQVHAIRGSGAGATFRFGEGYGIILGVLAALERPVIHVAPTVWTKAMKVGSDKGVHRRMCMDLWPSQAHLFSRVKDDGRADAALLAVWARCHETEAG